MSKNLTLLLLMAFSLPLAMFGQTAVTVDEDHPFLDTFEGESCGWTFLNGSSNNAWAWGTATASGGYRSMYISQDGGATNTYNTGASTWVYATKTFVLANGDYVISYDWKAEGESGCDYIRVGMLPNATTPSVGSGLPNGWISLDGNTQLNGSSEWANKTVHFGITTAGTYKICFAWYNDGSVGTNPPGAIDNVSVSRYVMDHSATLTQSTYSDFVQGTGQNVVIDDNVSLQSKMNDIYDFEATTNLPQTLMNHQVVAWQDYVFCVGGHNGNNPVNTVYRAVQNESGVSSWTTLTDMAVVATQQYLVVMGGKNDEGVSSKIYVATLDPLNAELGEWEESSISLPQPLWGARAIAVHDNIYLVGGATTDSETAAINKVYCLKLNSRGNVASIEEVTDLPEARNGHAIVSYDSKIYVTGGHDANGVLKTTVWSATVNLDGTLGTWTAQTAMPVALSNHSAVCTNGILAVIGGMGEELPSNQLYYTYMDGTALDWVTSSVVLSVRTHSGASCAFGDKIFFTGGQNLSGSVLNFMRYATVETGDELVNKANFISMPFDLGNPMKTIEEIGYTLSQAGSNTSYEMLYRVADTTFVYGDWISAGVTNPFNINEAETAVQFMFRLTATSTDNIQVDDLSVTFSGYTQLEGNLDHISVLPLSGSPYLVTSDITFTTGIHDIEAGVVIYFTENTELRINRACVYFNGTEEAPILLTYLYPDENRWNGVCFYDNNYNHNAGVYNSDYISSMSYTTIENGGYGDNQANLRLYRAGQLTFTNCTFTGSNFHGIRLYDSNTSFTNCTIADNAKNALDLDYSSPVLTSCTMTNNNYAVYIRNSNSDPTFATCAAWGNHFGLYSYTPDRDFVYDATTLDLYDNDIEIRTAGGYINYNTTWAFYDNGYQVDGNLNINNSSNKPILTIGAGNTIRMASGKYIQISYGGIHAVGTETDSITFTALNGQIGGWEGFDFYDNSDNGCASSLRYCVIEKANTNLYCEYTTQPSLMYSTVKEASNRNIELYQSELSLDAVHINDAPYGIYLNYNSTATMVMTSFDNLSNACVWHYDTGSSTNFFTSTMSNSNIGVGFNNPNLDIPTYANRITFNNVTSPVGLNGGTIRPSRTWLINDYSIFGDIYVRSNNSNDTVRLTIDPGTTLRFAQNVEMYVGDYYNEELYAEGIEEAPITFTSLNGEVGGWNGLRFYSNTRNSLLKYCVFENGNEYNVYAYYTSNPVFENCEFRNSNGYGIDLYQSAPELTDCDFNNNASYGVYFTDAYYVDDVMEGLQFDGNLVDGIAINGGTVSTNRTWPAYDYIILNNVYVRQNNYNSNDTISLTLNPGITLRFAQGKYMSVGDYYNYNVLNAEGTEEAPITFTSLNGEVGGWNGLRFYEHTIASLLKHCIIENGNEYNVYVSNTNYPVFENCEFRNSNSYGMRITDYAGPTISLSSIHDNASHGFYLDNYSSANPVIGNSPEMGNDIINNGGYAIYQDGSNDIEAAYNFFGTVDSLYIENNLIRDKIDYQWDGRVNVFPVSMLPVSARTISGTMLYDGNAEYAMEGSTVMVKDFADSLLYQTTTDATGHFSFDTISYLGAKKIGFAPVVDVESTITTADALAVMLHYVHESMLTGNRLEAADVNGSLTVNGTDALLIQKRYVNQIETFPMGDMYYSLYDSVAYNNYAADLTITALCYGDVNASYAAPSRDGITLLSEGQVLVGSDQVVEIPVRVKTGIEAGSISIKLAYPAEYLSVEGVVLPNGEEAMLYDNNGVVTVSWYSLAPMYLSSGETLMTLVVRTKDLDGMGESIVFGLDSRSELTDGNAIVLSDVELAMPEMVTMNMTNLDEQGSAALTVYPNPMRDRSVVSFSLTMESRVSFVVYDLLGNTVKSVEEGRLGSGQHEIELSGLASGVYVGRLAVSGSHEDVQIVKIVVE